MSLTDHVDPAIELIEDRLPDRLGPDALAYLRSHAFFNQLAPADACLRSFLAHELDPASPVSLGGDGNASLGDLVRAEEVLAEPLRRAVATAVTSSYLMMMSREDPPGAAWVSGRDGEPLWRFWIDHLRPTAIPAFGIPQGFADSIARGCGAYLESEIARLRLRPGLLRRRPLSQRCTAIGRAGLLLRIGQTTACSDAEFERYQTGAEAGTRSNRG